MSTAVNLPTPKRQLPAFTENRKPPKKRPREGAKKGRQFKDRLPQTFARDGTCFHHSLDHLDVHLYHRPQILTAHFSRDRAEGHADVARGAHPVNRNHVALGLGEGLIQIGIGLIEFFHADHRRGQVIQGQRVAGVLGQDLLQQFLGLDVFSLRDQGSCHSRPCLHRRPWPFPPRTGPGPAPGK